jgi:hypothetical protein
MTGAELRCVVCGAPAADAAPDYVADPAPGEWLPGQTWALAWTCTGGHSLITGRRDPETEWQTVGPKAQPRPVDLQTGPQKSPRGDHHE